MARKKFTSLIRHVAKGSLRERYLAPPFSVLDTTNAHWQQRRAKWLALGIKPEIPGRKHPEKE